MDYCQRVTELRHPNHYSDLFPYPHAKAARRMYKKLHSIRSKDADQVFGPDGGSQAWQRFTHCRYTDPLRPPMKVIEKQEQEKRRIKQILEAEESEIAVLIRRKMNDEGWIEEKLTLDAQGHINEQRKDCLAASTLRPKRENDEKDADAMLAKVRFDAQTKIQRKRKCQNDTEAARKRRAIEDQKIYSVAEFIHKTICEGLVRDRKMPAATIWRHGSAGYSMVLTRNLHKYIVDNKQSIIQAVDAIARDVPWRGRRSKLNGVQMHKRACIR